MMDALKTIALLIIVLVIAVTLWFLGSWTFNVIGELEITYGSLFESGEPRHAERWTALLAIFIVSLPLTILLVFTLGSLIYAAGFFTKNKSLEIDINSHQKLITQLRKQLAEQKNEAKQQLHKLQHDFENAYQHARRDIAAEFSEQESKIETRLNELRNGEEELAQRENQLEFELAKMSSEVNAALKKAQQAEQKAQYNYNKHIQSLRLKTRYEKRWESVKRQLQELKASRH